MIFIIIAMVLLLLALGLIAITGNWGAFKSGIILSKNMSDCTANVNPENIPIGANGVTTTMCKPVGKCKINDEIFEVISINNFIDSNKKVIVKKINNGSVYVEEIVSM